MSDDRRQLLVDAADRVDGDLEYRGVESGALVVSYTPAADDLDAAVRELGHVAAVLSVLVDALAVERVDVETTHSAVPGAIEWQLQEAWAETYLADRDLDRLATRVAATVEIG